MAVPGAAHRLVGSRSGTGELGAAQLGAAESLVRAAFGASFRSHDWLHAVEGTHVLVTDNQVLVAHAAVVPRTLRLYGNPLDTGYVEGVAVRADQRGRGLGRVVMDHAEALICARHSLGALNAVDTAADFYGARGWKPWTGHTQAIGPAGIIDTFDDADRIYLLNHTTQVEPVNPAIPLICDWRVGDLW